MLSLCCHVILGDSSLNNPTSHPHSPCGRRSRNARVVFFCGVQVVLYLEAAAAMSGEAEALLVVNQLRDLAADPMNRRAIVQDQGCLPGLILFLDHPNPQVVYSALLALRYLAECRANREKMEGELGMMLSLQNVIQKSTTPGETKLLASEVYELLQASSGPESDRAEGAPSESQDSVRRGPAEDPRGYKFHLSDGCQEVHRSNPLRPQGGGEIYFAAMFTK
ncbi:armadillo repeat-containing protein 1-like isoform X9 [Gadus macrocephalus]|uniref:armadillo repeat-containing protein 1-like isoform X9 n=1 Tax=Gadus macrocephalus TaxID=80720 RepID=UPI0028CB3D1E|nr:armadillo repeat-containing protein 1-like isoform X9 [Gadus macrocephalus]